MAKKKIKKAKTNCSKNSAEMFYFDVFVLSVIY